MARKAVTIRDVARHAGVSVATASRALNGKDVVNAQTRDRILLVMERAGLRAEPRGAPSEPRPDIDRRRRRLVPHPAAGCRTPAGRRRRSDRQRVRPRHLQRRVGPEAGSVPRHAGPVAADRRANRDVPSAARLGRPGIEPGDRCRSCSSMSIRRRSPPCRESSETTRRAARLSRDISLTSGIARSASSATRSPIRSASHPVATARLA